MTGAQRTLRIRHIAAAICAAAALLIAAAAVWLGLGRGARDVTVLAHAGDPGETVARFFNALCLRDWDGAARYVRGEPALDLARTPEDAMEKDVWEAFLRSWSWSMGEGGRTDSVTAWQTVEFTCLRPELLFDGLDRDIQALLGIRVQETETLSDVYTEEGEFREDVVLQALHQAVETRLTDTAPYRASTTVTLQLIYEEGRWQILPEETLWNALSGVAEGGSAA